MLKYTSKIMFLLLVFMAIVLCACNKQGGAKGQDAFEDSSDNPIGLDDNEKIKYDTQMMAIIKSVDTEVGMIVLQDVETGISYTLTYAGETHIYDKYDTEMSMSQVATGDVVQAYYYKAKMRLTGVRYKKEVWVYEDIFNWKVDKANQRIKIGKEQYYYKDDLVILSEGQEISFIDLNEQDILSIRGQGRLILSITVDKGHGFIRLTGIQEFIDGWIEIGKIIKPVKENMLIVAPEGNHNVKIVKDGFGGTLSASVKRNEETVVDFAELGAKAVKYGTIEFTIEPEDATLYIAGAETSFDSPILLEYDTYRVVVKADGYEDLKMDLKVNNILIQKTIKLESKTNQSASPSRATASPAEASATPDPKASNITSSMYKIHVNMPEGAAVYFDDSYVGIAPIAFSKVSGVHTLTLSKSGYVTKSYTIEVGTENTDVTFTLPELVAE